MKRNSKLKQKKQEITLMTLLANESAKESANILSKYGIPKAKNHYDLEVKLAKLYFSPKTDKLKLESELAEIHPHTKWISKALKLKSSEQIEKLEKELQESAKKSKEESITKEVCVDDNCIVHGTNTKTSNFSGNENAQENSSSNKLTNSMEVVGLVGIVGLLGITLVLVSKNLK
tara:strand:- start:1087 stop:1611 length:525 start_codon:yes stop_codon:yes gene_type:complete